MNLQPIVSESHPDKIPLPLVATFNSLHQQAQAHFGPDLLAVYLLGSIGRGQEQVGSSDLDLELVLNHHPSPEEYSWAKQVSHTELTHWPDLLKIDLDLLDVAVLLAPDSQRLRFIMASDGLKLWGQELLTTAESWTPGPELARLLNGPYQSNRAHILHCIQAPTAEEQEDPHHIATCMHWIAKQALRLGLGLAMCEKPVYTRTVSAMPALVSEIIPALKPVMDNALAMYYQPSNDLARALEFMQHLESLYALADLKMAAPRTPTQE